MVDFGNSYSHPMDRDYDKNTEVLDLSPRNIGMSVPMGIAAGNVQGVSAKIRQGVSAIEIGFPGAVRGNRQAHTPGMYGRDTRLALKELAKANEISLTTHAAYNVMGLSGQDQQGNFSKEQKKTVVDEVKRAIEFARDTAGGGSVVVHTGEVERPISEEPWAMKADGSYQFLQHPEEAERAIIRVVDDRTGQVMQQVRKNQEVARPEWKVADSDYEGQFQLKTSDENKHLSGKSATIKIGDFIDYEGHKIIDPYDARFGRVPEYDDDPNSKNYGRFKVKRYDWNDFINEAKQRNNFLAKQKGLSVEQFKERHQLEYQEPEEAFIRATLETNEGHSRGWALSYGERFEKYQKQLKKVKETLEYYKKLEAATPEDELWKLKQSMGTRTTIEQLGLAPREDMLPSKIIQEELNDIRKSMEFSHQASVSQEQQATDSRTTQEHVMSAKKYALVESERGFAAAGIYAMQNTKNKEKPLFISMENIFPERYGGHPTELYDLIKRSRNEFVRQLTDPFERDIKGKILRTAQGKERLNQNYMKDMNKQKATDMAEKHIKATFDTGHANMWRKYWQHDPNKTRETNDKEFNKWYLGQVEKLAKDNMIGNVHLTDNFGYQDDHLAPGQGNTPVREVVAILKKHGYDKALTVEPGADASTDNSDFHGVMKTWRHFGSPVYGLNEGTRVGAPARWGEVQYSYFGQNRPPNYVFGSYSPSNDWTLWSGVQLE